MEAVLDREAIFKLGYHWVGDEEEAAEQIEFVRRLLYLPVGSKILMPFCGPGWYAHELSMWGFQVVGMEIVHSFLQEARLSGQRQGLSTSFLHAEPLKLPFRDEKFDGAMVIGNRFGMTGDELTDLEFLRELARVIKSQGRFVAVLPHRDGVLNSFQERDWETTMNGSRILIFRKWDAATGQMWEEWWDVEVGRNTQTFIVAYRAYTLTELDNLLRKSGFSITNAFGNFIGGELTHKSRWMIVQSVKL